MGIGLRLFELVFVINLKVLFFFCLILFNNCEEVDLFLFLVCVWPCFAGRDLLNPGRGVAGSARHRSCPFATVRVGCRSACFSLWRPLIGWLE